MSQLSFKFALHCLSGIIICRLSQMNVDDDSSSGCASVLQHVDLKTISLYVYSHMYVAVSYHGTNVNCFYQRAEWQG